ncbi:MAG: hypothetical protein PHP11_05520 [Erysipelotrichaceae bacterium]|nr:hypothetical protein [Erysipelotrichaceae bacterium]MDD3924540.1 hypothetical protein [Erysipelotrichaceae bacterium]MDD4642360.1 hypothetical protein [Erysipelotrichaceae bacterium]
MLRQFRNIIAPIRYKECYDAYCDKIKSNSKARSFCCGINEYEIDNWIKLFAFSYKYAIGFGIFMDNMINRHLRFNDDSFVLEVLVRVIITVIVSLMIEAISIRMFVKSARKPKI